MYYRDDMIDAITFEFDMSLNALADLLDFVQFENRHPKILVFFLPLYVSYPTHGVTVKAVGSDNN